MTRATPLDEARYVLGLLPSSRAVEIAEQVLLEGSASETVLQLALFSRADATWADIDELFRKALPEIGFGAMNRSTAQVVVIRHVAEQYLLGKLSTSQFLREIYGLAGWGIADGAIRNPLLTDHLYEIDYLDSMYGEAADSSPRRAAVWEKEIQKACRQILSQIPAPEQPEF